MPHRDTVALRALLEEGLSQRLYSGAAAGVSTPSGRVVATVGTHADDDSVPVTPASLFDLASVTKTFTAAVIVRLAEQGRVDLDAPVAQLLPVGRGPGAEQITLRMLLTHVSGLPAESFLWRETTTPEAERIPRVLATELESMPDEVYRYSCVGYVAAGAVAERATGQTLPDLLAELVSHPLGLASVSFGPVDPSRAVATEAQPWAGSGMLRGRVHDELSRYLGGEVGNAGLFATVDDVLGFAESFLDERIFGSDSLRQLTTNGLLPHHGASFGQALGPRIDDREFLGDAVGIGHIGFTGTMWSADPRCGLAATLLTNSVHPHRDHADLSDFRRRFSAWAASYARGT